MDIKITELKVFHSLLILSISSSTTRKASLMGSWSMQLPQLR
jgi:hypothetical protein